MKETFKLKLLSLLYMCEQALLEWGYGDEKMLRFFNKFYRSKENINKQEMEDIIRNNNNVLLLDVRSPQEYNEGHLKNAINIPTYEIYEKAKTIIPDKSTIIICYCTIGVRSKKAIGMLKKLGYNNLYHLEGGI